MKNVIAFKNEAQKILFETEIRGQLSDGYWENTTPNNHWQPWCRAEVIVSPDNPGRDFHVRKDNYALTSPTLLSIVGDRMIEAVRRGLSNSFYDMKQLKADLKEMKKAFQTVRRSEEAALTTWNAD